MPLKVFREWPEIRHTFSLNEKQNFAHGSWIYWRQFTIISCYFIQKLFHFVVDFFVSSCQNSQLKCWNIYFRNVPSFHALIFFFFLCLFVSPAIHCSVHKTKSICLFLLFISSLPVVIEPTNLVPAPRPRIWTQLKKYRNAEGNK